MLETNVIKIDNNKWSRVRHDNYKLMLRVKPVKASRIFYL